MNDINRETTEVDLGVTAIITFPYGFEASVVADVWGLLDDWNPGIPARWRKESDSLVVSNLRDGDLGLVEFITELLNGLNGFYTHDLYDWIEAARQSDLDTEVAVTLWWFFNPDPISMEMVGCRRANVHRRNLEMAEKHVVGFPNGDVDGASQLAVNHVDPQVQACADGAAREKGN